MLSTLHKRTIKHKTSCMEEGSKKRNRQTERQRENSVFVPYLVQPFWKSAQTGGTGGGGKVDGVAKKKAERCITNKKNNNNNSIIRSHNGTSPSGNEDMILYSRKYIHLCILWACLLAWLHVVVLLRVLFIFYYSRILSSRPHTSFFPSIRMVAHNLAHEYVSKSRNSWMWDKGRDKAKGLDNWTQHAAMRCICTPPKEEERTWRKKERHTSEEREGRGADGYNMSSKFTWFVVFVDVYICLSV